MRDVVFVNTPCPELNDDRLEAPLGILYLATLVQKMGISCQICDLSGLDSTKWLEQIPAAKIYAFSTYSVTYARTLEIKNLILQNINPQALTIAGGPHVSALAVESAKDFDLIITGEADQTFPEVITNYKANGYLAKGILVGQPLQDLDRLPFPNYDLTDLASYNRIVETKPSISLISSRGCPYNCKFCNSLVFSRGQLRFRSPENVVTEIQSLNANFGTTNFRFSDDLFTFSPHRITEMTKAIAPLDILYRVFARANNLNSTACEQLAQSGCRHVAIGVESMSNKMLSILGKQTRAETNLKAIQNAKAAGLKVRIYILVGFPGETEETIYESIEGLKNCPFDEFVVYPFIPYPGTAVWENPEAYGATIDRDYSKYIQVGRGRSTCYVVQTEYFTPQDVEVWRDLVIETMERKLQRSWAQTLPDNR